MSANSRAIQAFKVWMEYCRIAGWSQDHMKALADLWWKHHDDNGRLYPPGKERIDAAGGRPEEKT